MRWYMNEDREMLQAAFKDFAQNRVRPHVDKMETEEADAKELILEMGQLGFFNLAIPEKYDGANDFISFGLMLEEMAKESYTVGFLAMIAQLFNYDMTNGCSEEQIQKYVIPAMNGEHLIALASCEPTGGSYFDGYTTRAKRDGDSWVISGTKCFITQADTADYFLVAALTKDSVDPYTGDGYDYFIIPADAPGVSTGHIENKIGWHGSRTGNVYFNDVKVSEADHLPGKIMLMPVRGVGSFYAALDLGGAEAVLEKVNTFVKNRIQDGGRSLWDNHETVRNGFAKLSEKVSVLRNALYGHLSNLNADEFSFEDDFALKRFGAEVLEEVTKESMLLMGGTGYIYETGVERYLRDAVLSEVGCGSNNTALSWIAATL